MCLEGFLDAGDQHLAQSEAGESVLGVVDGVEDGRVRATPRAAHRGAVLDDVMDGVDQAAGKGHLDEDHGLLGHHAVVEGEAHPVLAETLAHLLEAQHGVDQLALLEEADLVE